MIPRSARPLPANVSEPGSVGRLTPRSRTSSSTALAAEPARATAHTAKRMPRVGACASCCGAEPWQVPASSS
ncbi:hypothetical protein ACFPRL_02080 [Pseudoclavibacter helvolus]